MELYNLGINQEHNILPHDGVVNYYGKILQADEAQLYFKLLRTEIEWKHDEAIIFGKHITTKRKVAWYGDKAFNYAYSNITKKALVWNDTLLTLKNIIEKTTGETFNSCLLNLYHNGDEGMAWHSDGEKDLKKNGAIASLTLGAERTFSFKHKKTQDKVSLLLEHGSLLIMKEQTQSNWLHRLPPSKKKYPERINLTFRTIV